MVAFQFFVCNQIPKESNQHDKIPMIINRGIIADIHSHCGSLQSMAFLPEYKIQHFQAIIPCCHALRYAVTDAAYSALIKLVADICQRNGIKKLVWSTSKSDCVNHANGCNMTVHRDYANKACPGQYLYERHGTIAAAVNEILGVA